MKLSQLSLFRLRLLSIGGCFLDNPHIPPPITDEDMWETSCEFVGVDPKIQSAVVECQSPSERFLREHFNNIPAMLEHANQFLRASGRNIAEHLVDPPSLEELTHYVQDGFDNCQEICDENHLQQIVIGISSNIRDAYPALQEQGHYLALVLCQIIIKHYGHLFEQEQEQEQGETPEDWVLV